MKPLEHHHSYPADGAQSSVNVPARARGISRSERWFRSLVQNASDIVAILKADGTLRYLSPSVERVLGYRPEELVGTLALDHVHPEDIEFVSRSLAESGQTSGVLPAVEFRVRAADDSWRYMEAIRNNLLDDPDIRGIVINARDVTERKETEKALEESERRFSSVVSDAHAYVYRCLNEPGWPNEFASDYALELTGYPPEDLLVEGPTRFGDLIVKEDRERVWEEIQEALAERRSFELRYAIRHRYGEIRHVQEYGRGIYGEGGDVVALEGLLYDITEQVETERRLTAAEERYRTLVERIPALVYIQEPEEPSRTTYVSPQNETILGYTQKECLADPDHWIKIMHPDDRERVLKEDERTNESGQSFRAEYRQIAKDGRIVWIRDEAAMVRDENGEALYWLGVQTDITERKQAEQALRRSEASLAEAQRMAHLGSWEWDLKTDQVWWSDETYRIYGFEPKAFVPTLENVEQAFHPEDKPVVRKRIEAALQEAKPYDFEHRIVRPDGGVRWVHRRAEMVRGEEGEPLRMIGTLHDITERKVLEQDLEYRAFHDSLTDLPNRHLFVDRLGHALSHTGRRRGRKVAVLFMDLDGFKVINDSLGHEMGDRLLVEVAERLKGCLRPEDTLARFGGDEFTVLIEEVEDPEDTVRVAKRMVKALEKSLILGRREVFVSASIGIAMGEERTKSAEDLLRDADAAMYQAKEGSSSGYRVFDPSMHERVMRRLELEGELRRAIEAEEFVLHYQPIMRLKGEVTWGVEALVRWNHPERGLVSPAEFILVAEESGLIVPLGRWVLGEACRQAKQWQEEHPRNPPLVVSVNLSARQLELPDLAEIVEKALRETGLEARCLSLDVTETTYINVLEGNTATLDRVKALGVGLSIDDFGMGYSSLSYLKRLPADDLKIDKVFAAGLGEDIEDTAIVRMVIELAHTLGMEVVAEGVESADQAQQLAEMGCDLAQGYHFAKALPPEEASEFLVK